MNFLAGMVKNSPAFSTNQKTGLVKNLKMRYITLFIAGPEHSLGILTFVYYGDKLFNVHEGCKTPA